MPAHVTLPSADPLDSTDRGAPAATDAVPSPGAADSLDTTDIANQMLRDVQSHTEKEAVLAALARTIQQQIPAAAVHYFPRDAGGDLVARPLWLGTAPTLREAAAARLGKLAAQACQTGSARRGSLGAELGNAVLVPVVFRDCNPEVIGVVIMPGSQVRVERAVEVLQFAAAHVTLWHVLQTSLKAEQVAKHSTALLDLLGRMESTESLDDACTTLASDAQQFLACRRVVVGVCPRKGGHCKVRAISGLAKFDPHARQIQDFENALDQVILSGQFTEYPSPSGVPDPMSRALQQLQDAVGFQGVFAAPLVDDQQEPVGAWLLLDPPAGSQRDTTRQFVRAASRQIGACLRVVQRAAPSRVTRLLRKSDVAHRRLKRALATVAVLLAVAALFVPLPHHIHCDCTVQPAVRRFVAAPFDGILKTTRVEPGDEVEKGQLLAELDGREIRLRLASLEAELERATKEWDAALSLEDIAGAQQAALERKKLAMQIQLLHEHESHLKIRSPIAGVVVSGDLENSQGAPVTVGQTLFEIAPTDRMMVEVEIPEPDIRFVTEGMRMRVRLESAPHAIRQVAVKNIVPRAQVRDDQLVFVAKSELEASSDMLRPGMSGKATLLAPKRRLGWLLFHRPIESLLMTFGW